ncbi:uncharacterized protein LOC110233719 [Exaiptasia diaphana]|uniref:Uncharacterized protein n=1 Tax=Exaiptasia diaphana TaxID=2652724 RepID=A0A913WVB8_EXADI|nr:uncharacterized protein LOC110233719 [Exaiptasia diaphana]
MVTLLADTNFLSAGICGIFILLCGIGNTIGGIVWVGKFAPLGFWTDGSGLWSGIPLIIAGALGIAAWPRRSHGLMNSFLAMCIIACIAASVQAIVSGIAHAVWAEFIGDNCISTGYGCVCTSSSGQREYLRNSKACDLVSTVVGGLVAFIVLSSLGALFTLAGSIIACIVTCNVPQSPPLIIQQPAVTGISVVTSHTQSRVAHPNQYLQQPPQQLHGFPPQFQGCPPQQSQQPQGFPQQFQGYPQQSQQPQGVPQQGVPPPQYCENAAQ